MYYDTTEKVFKSYVPSTWVADNGSLYFNFSVNGQFNQNQTNVRYFARNATAHEGTYQYTALGVHDNYDINLTSGQAAYAQGVGTWNDIEKISFSTGEHRDLVSDGSRRCQHGLQRLYSGRLRFVLD